MTASSSVRRRSQSHSQSNARFDDDTHLTSKNA
jgi:hypothetical protein